MLAVVTVPQLVSCSGEARPDPQPVEPITVDTLNVENKPDR